MPKNAFRFRILESVFFFSNSAHWHGSLVDKVLGEVRPLQLEPQRGTEQARGREQGQHDRGGGREARQRHAHAVRPSWNERNRNV